MSRIRRYTMATLACVLTLTVFTTASYAQTTSPTANNPINHIIVIYLENHSFDNLYGQFPGAKGLSDAQKAAPQVDKSGAVYKTLPQPLNTSVNPPPPYPPFPADLPTHPLTIA